MPEPEVGNLLGSIMIFENAIVVDFEKPVDKIDLRLFLETCTMRERLVKELTWLSQVPDEQIELWDDMVSRLQQAQYPEPFTIGLYETLLKEKPAEDRDKDVA